jgi:hypothetical protein
VLSLLFLLAIVLSVLFLLAIVLSVLFLLAIVLSVPFLLAIVLSVLFLLAIVLSVLFLLAIVLSVLFRLTDSDYKPKLGYLQTLLVCLVLIFCLKVFLWRLPKLAISKLINCHRGNVTRATVNSFVCQLIFVICLFVWHYNDFLKHTF